MSPRGFFLGSGCGRVRIQARKNQPHVAASAERGEAKVAEAERFLQDTLQCCPGFSPCSEELWCWRPSQGDWACNCWRGQGQAAQYGLGNLVYSQPHVRLLEAGAVGEAEAWDHPAGHCPEVCLVSPSSPILFPGFLLPSFPLFSFCFPGEALAANPCPGSSPAAGGAWECFHQLTAQGPSLLLSRQLLLLSLHAPRYNVDSIQFAAAQQLLYS